MADNPQDPVGNLFKNLLAPDTDYVAGSLEHEFGNAQLRGAVLIFMQESRSWELSDMEADHAYLFKQFSTLRDKGILTPSAIIDTLCQLATFTKDHSQAENGDSLKARHLKYLAWVAAGRKDETSPFATPGTGSASLEGHSILPENNPDSACAACGKTGAQRLIQCQLGHWAEHKKVCGFLSKLCRAASILDELVCLSSEAARVSYNHPVSIEEREGMVRNQLPSEAQDTGLAVSGAHISGKAHDVAPSRELFLAALTNGSCREILGGSMRPFLDLALEPLLSAIQVVKFWPKNMHRPVYGFIGAKVPDFEPVEGMNFNSTLIHEVLRVTLVDGSKFVIDPGRRQYGWKEFLAPWETYSRERVHKLVFEHFAEELVKPEMSIFDGPSLEAQLDGFSKTRIDGEPDFVSAYLSLIVNQAVAACVNMHAEKEFNGFEKFLSLAARDFEAARQSVIAKVKALLDDRVEWLKGRKEFRLYMDPETNEHEIAFGKQLCEKLERVWFSEEEYEELKDDPRKVRALWKERWVAEMGEDYLTGYWRRKDDVDVEGAGN